MGFETSDSIAAVLQRHEFGLFEGLDPSLIADAFSRSAIRTFAPGDILLRRDEVNRDLLLLADGRLQIKLELADIGFSFAIERGEFAGEMSIIVGQPTTAYVIAETECTVIAVPEDCLWQALVTVPGLMRNLLRLVTLRMRQRNAAMFEAQKQRMRLEEMERELANAREIQTSMLPRQRPLFRSEIGLDIEAVMVPAREVGGDFYDAILLGQHRVCLVVGDVSGKGMPAALFMARTLAQLRSEARAGIEVDELLRHLNRALSADNPSCMFVTLCAVIIDTETRQVDVACGGHDAPVVRQGSGVWTVMPKPSGPLVGFAPEARFAMHRLSLEPGDRLLLYTDGVTEAENAAKEQYSASRLLHCLQASTANNSGELVEALRADLARHVAEHPPSDDITILTLRFAAQQERSC